MSKNVFILGAGASAHAGAPLMSQFMDEIEAMGKSPSGEKFRLIIGKLHELNAIHSKADIDFMGNLESAMAICEIANLLQSFKPDINLLNLFKSLICKVLEEKIHFNFRTDMKRQFLNSEYGKLVRLIQKMGLSETTVLTFNYDIALDYACYIQDIPISYCLSQDAPQSGLKLLKLHGSTNWG